MCWLRWRKAVGQILPRKDIYTLNSYTAYKSGLQKKVAKTQGLSIIDNDTDFLKLLL